MVVALDGSEPAYPVYRFSRRYFYEKPRNNPFANITPDPTPPDPDPPAGVIDLIVSNVGTTTADLDWTDISDNEDVFELEQADNIDFIDRKIAILPANTIAITLSGLTPSTTYYWRVRALNADGYSQYSNTAQAMTLAIPVPAAPIDLDANSTGNSGEIQLDWTDVATDELGYYVNRRISKINKKGKEAGFEPWERIDTIAADSVGYLDTGLIDGRLYQYTVEPYNDGGSALSNVAGARPAQPLPLAPTLLVATTGATVGEIDLAWTDNATDEDSYKVERSDDGVSGWVTIDDTLAADSVAYTDTGLTAGQVYYYRVSAVNDAGSSLPSNVSSAQAKAAFDPLYDSDAVFHLQPTEADDATDMTEVSPWRKTLFRNGSPTIEDTVQKWTGLNSLYLVASDNDFIYTYEHPSHFHPDADMTIEGWFYPTFLNGLDSQGIFGNRSGTNGWQLYRNTDDTLILLGYNGVGTPVLNISSTETISLNTWHHIAIEYKHNTGGATGAWSVYLDGDRVATGTQTADVTIEPIWNLGSQTGSTRRFEGYITDVLATRRLKYDAATYSVPGGAFARGENNYPTGDHMIVSFDNGVDDWTLVGDAAATTLTTKWGSGGALEMGGGNISGTNYAEWEDAQRHLDLQREDKWYIDFWVQLRSKSAGEYSGVLKWVPADSTIIFPAQEDQIYTLQWNNGNSFWWQLQDAGANDIVGGTSYTNGGDSVWHRHTISCDGTWIRWYVNGNFQARGAKSLWARGGGRNIGHLLRLGAGDPSTDNHDCDAVYDDLHIFKGVELYRHENSPGGDINPRVSKYPNLDLFPADKTDWDPVWLDVTVLAKLEDYTDDGPDVRTITQRGATDYLSADGAKFGLKGLDIPNLAGGTQAGAEVSATGFPTINNAYTMEGWVKIEDSAGGLADFMGLWGFTNTNTDAGWMQMQWRKSDGAIAVSQYSGGVQDVYTTSGSQLTTGVWHHVAAVRRKVVGGSWTIKIFVDGVAQVTSTATGLITHNSANTWPWGVGMGASPANNQPFYGGTDEFRLSVGVVRYWSNFTAPTDEFPTTGYGA